jgi:hypothetical protein
MRPARENEHPPVYSAEITEIIGIPPRWIVRGGGSLLLAIFMTCLFVASVIRVPKQHSSPVTLHGATRPYYLRQIVTGARWAVGVGSIIKKGQALLQGGNSETTLISAPFAGQLMLQSQLYSASPGDTIGMLIPLNNTYRFTGTIDLGQTKQLSSRMGFPIEVTLSKRTQEKMVLYGRLGYITPTIQNGHVTYVGELDSSSNAMLSQRLLVAADVPGMLVFTTVGKPLLQSLFH